MSNRPCEHPKPGHQPRSERQRGWGYEGEAGPSRWASLKPDYASCSHGHEQSPINISGVCAADLEPLRFSYHADDWKISDDGHTVQVEVPSGSVVEIRGTTYQLTQFHFHTRAENMLEGEQFDMELHLVHEDRAGKLAVVGVWLQGGGPEHPTLARIWDQIPGIRHQQDHITDDKLDPGDLLPRERGYFNWAGSLTTPPCSEGVDWNMLKTPLRIADTQLATFRALYRGNCRPIQPLHGRVITASR